MQFFVPPYFSNRSLLFVCLIWLGWTVKRAQLLKFKAQLSSIRAKGCILMTVCVLSDLTWLPLFGVGRKSWYIIIMLINLVFLLGIDRPSILIFSSPRNCFLYSRLSSSHLFFFVSLTYFIPSVPMRECLHVFLISYSLTEWYLLFHEAK